ncbi:MAG: 50S ribosomal protein L17 [Nitrospinae bacterium]|nr:50S ribosomal protein L17 [Nitrospinota bacterium]
MRHRRAGRRLNRTTEHRIAMTRNMMTSLVEEERIRTTLPKAKEVRRHFEKLITTSKNNTLHARRKVAGILRTPSSVKKIMEVIGPRYIDRPGGYTRILKLPPRPGDSADMAILELVDRDTSKEDARRETRQKKEEDKPES